MKNLKVFIWTGIVVSTFLFVFFTLSCDKPKPPIPPPIVEKVVVPDVPVVPVVPPVVKVMPVLKESAKRGEGVTHITRRAIQVYISNKNIKLSPEQKIYAEDYITKKFNSDASLGGKPLMLKMGTSITFSPDLIQRGVEKSQKLTPEQLTNLTQYVKIVKWV